MGVYNLKHPRRETMKRPFILATALAAALLSLEANAAEPAGTYLKSSDGQETTGLAWKCGKKNPAMWGTFGNGCLKQKRKWKKQKSSASGVGGLTTSQQQPNRAKLKQ